MSAGEHAYLVAAFGELGRSVADEPGDATGEVRRVARTHEHDAKRHVAGAAEKRLELTSSEGDGSEVLGGDFAPETHSFQNRGLSRAPRTFGMAALGYELSAGAPDLEESRLNA